MRPVPPPLHSSGPASSPWRSRIVGEAEVPPAELIAHPSNWRRHPESQRRALRGLLAEVGWVQRIIVNIRTGHVLDGHARLEEALARGEALIPVIRVDLAPDEELQVLALLDPIGALATANSAALAELLAGISTGDADLRALLRDLASAHGVNPMVGADPDAVPDLPEPADTYVQPGQLWRLGDHRLLCGDALDPAAVARVLDGATPSLLTTDPPYGVSLDLRRRHRLDDDSDATTAPRRGAGHRNVSLAGDDRIDWAAAYALVPSITVGYVWRPGLYARMVTAGLEGIGFEVVSEIIWVKTRFSIGRRWYHWKHEACVVVRRRGARVAFLGQRDQGTVWEAPSPKVGGRDADPKVDHPAQKPVTLFERPIRNHLHPGEATYDPFLGSGTALVAAEVSGRRCFGMELDPRYVQVAIECWQAVTGQHAELLGQDR